MSILRKLLGVGSILLGIIALLTPFTPGAWLIFVGLGILGIEVAADERTWYGRWAKRFGMKVKKKVEEVKEEIKGDS